MEPWPYASAEGFCGDPAVHETHEWYERGIWRRQCLGVRHGLACVSEDCAIVMAGPHWHPAGRAAEALPSGRTAGGVCDDCGLTKPVRRYERGPGQVYLQVLCDGCVQP